MFEWTARFELQHNWVTLLLVLVFALFVALFKSHPRRLKYLLSFWDLNSYFQNFEKERLINPFLLFNLISNAISLIAFSLIGYVFYQNYLITPGDKIAFPLFIGSILILVVIRYFLLKAIFELLNSSDFFAKAIFRSMSFHALFGSYGLVFFCIYYYRFFQASTYYLLLCIVLYGCLFISHLYLYSRIIRGRLDRLIYLILYLCAFKIVPWLWLFNFFIRQKA